MTSGDGPRGAVPASERRGHLVGGGVLIAVGVMLLLGQLDVPGWHTRGWWPLILIAIGLARFLMQAPDRRGGAGLWLIFIGVMLLLHTQRVLHLRESWPLFIVAAGVSILLAARAAAADRIAGDRR